MPPLPPDTAPLFPQAQLERLVEKNYYLHSSAREAYRSTILAYNAHQLKDTFNVHKLDLQAVAKSFGFTAPPKVGGDACCRGPLSHGAGAVHTVALCAAHCRQLPRYSSLVGMAPFSEAAWRSALFSTAGC